jgi:hypothetical protein
VTNGSVDQMTRGDPAGTGPLPEVLVVAGSQPLAGTTACPPLSILDLVTATRTPLLPWFERVTALRFFLVAS